jgi:hypothetical protein
MIHFKALRRHRRKDDGKICPKPERLSAQELGLRATHYIMGPRRGPPAQPGASASPTLHTVVL